MRRRSLWKAYRLRWKRRRFLFRIWRKRQQISIRLDRTKTIGPNATLLFATVRNERARLPHFLEHYRALGVDHFLIVDNDSDDGTVEFLTSQVDVSIWSTAHSYRLARFGMDWLGWLQWTFGHGHWCLTVDADELLVYPSCDTRKLPELTHWLDQQGHSSFGAMMLDLYPKGPIHDVDANPDENPLKLLKWFDAKNYRRQIHRYYGNVWIQGGVRERVFFQDAPQKSPTLNKTPLVKWHRSFAYVSSTHQILPPRLHEVFSDDGPSFATGVLLHTKFLPSIMEKSVEELQRKEHFQNSALYQDYHRALSSGPNLWYDGSFRYVGPEQLVELGLMSKGSWG